MMKRGRNTTNGSHIGTIIGQDVSFNGELDFKGTVLIEGHFEGNIRSRDGGTLVVSEKARITGEVDVPNLILHGTIHGNVRACESLKMTPTGTLMGDVEYRVISLSEGASVNGRCKRIDEKHLAAVTTGGEKPPFKANPKLASST